MIDDNLLFNHKNILDETRKPNLFFLQRISAPLLHIAHQKKLTRPQKLYLKEIQSLTKITLLILPLRLYLAQQQIMLFL